MAEDLEEALTKIHEQIASLRLIAPRDGQVMGLPHPETTGQWSQAAREVGDPHQAERDPRPEPSTSSARVTGPGLPMAPLRTPGRARSVRSPSATVTTFLPSSRTPAAANKEQDLKTGESKPITAVYEVVIPIDNSDLALQPGLRGFAKIDGGTSTLGWWIWRMLAKTFHFTL